MLCPACESRSTGKVGVNQYYCWDCCIEFNNRSETFLVEEDGTLVDTDTPVYTS